MLIVPSGLFTTNIMYQYSVQYLSVISSCTSFVSSSMIFFSSHIFSQIKKLFLGSSDASPLNYGNLMVGSCPAILNDELLPSPSVDT
jgi:hypothetical protein